MIPFNGARKRTRIRAVLLNWSYGYCICREKQREIGVVKLLSRQDPSNRKKDVRAERESRFSATLEKNWSEAEDYTTDFLLRWQCTWWYSVIAGLLNELIGSPLYPTPLYLYFLCVFSPMYRGKWILLRFSNDSKTEGEPQRVKRHIILARIILEKFTLNPSTIYVIACERRI